MTMVLLLCILLGAASTAASVFEDSAEEGGPKAHHVCPLDWSSFGSLCYQLHKNNVSWISAEEHCNSLRAHLASATSPQEYTYLQQLAWTSGQSRTWLGGFNLQGRWMWIDHKGFYYSYWHSVVSPSNNPCIYLTTNSGWINSPCDLNLPFICSMNPFSC